ncbi:RNA polymerase sigma factor [Streptomyces sp. MMCC 100]|uniref:RNA polymerase sigma factor n=1 Tax=Streptomyces sp. MMCC 100 TaxID=3163555 RepID=UPI003594AF24
MPGDDGLLAVRAAEGDEDAFEVLVRRHAAGLLRLAASMLGSSSEAEDAVQDAFVSAWRRLPEFRGRSAFATWVHRIVVNRCLNMLRSRRPVAGLDSVPEPGALGRPLSELSPEQRVCWVLRELAGQSYETIAETVGISPEAARGRVFRARRCLTEAMTA